MAKSFLHSSRLELWLGLGIVGFVILSGVLGPLLVTNGPLEIHGDAPLRAPGDGYLLGTDDLGRDLLSRVLSGLRVSLLVSAVSVSFAAVVGILIGVACGYYRGALDAVLMRVVDILFAFPVMLLALLMVAILGSSTWTVILAISLVYVPHFARIARASAMSQSEEPYVGMLRSTGARGSRIMVRHILPNIAAPLLVQLTFSFSWAILVEASLSFLGLGLQPPDPSLGSMISDGQSMLRQAPWVALIPAAALFITIGGLNVLGDGLRDALDPRKRSSKKKKTKKPTTTKEVSA